MTIAQPNGEQISCFASGDEFFNWLHDSKGYTIIQSASNGYYYYAMKENDHLVPSSYRVNSVNPADVGLIPWQKISDREYKEKRHTFDSNLIRDTKAPTTGTINNIVIFIRFSDQDEFTNPRSFFDAKFNDSTPGNYSEYNFYKEISYNTLSINSSYYPTCTMTTNLSYQDTHPRNYYCAYNASTNPIGYQSGEAMDREQTLLKNAVLSIASQVPTSLNIDADNNGNLDNVCFIIRGGNEGWADLLWAHRYWLNSQIAYINNKRVYDYTFQPESQNDVTTLCHEMFHAMGAPDLYHYNSNGITCLGPWDIMESGTSHACSYMKYRYGHWISSIPTITASGTYWLHPLSYSNHNAYKIPCPTNSSQYFIVEYRKKEPGSFDNHLPASGLLVYRVNAQLDGLGNTNGPPDELYVYRPGGTNSADGEISAAMFSSDYNRTEFNDQSNPSCFLANGSNGGIFLHNISSCGDSISSILNPELGTLPGIVTTTPPTDDVSSALVSIGGQTINPDADGNFLVDIYQGNYTLYANLDGYGEVIQNNVSVVPYVLSPTVHVNFQRLSSPFNLTSSIAADSVHLNWEFDFNQSPQFDHFTIYISLNGTSFSGGRNTTDTHYTMHLTPNRDYWFYIRAVYSNGMSFPSNTIMANTSAVDDPNAVVPNQVRLMQNVPNPFNPETLIRFEIPVTIKNPVLQIYNVRGQIVQSFSCLNLSEIKWDGKDKNGGVVSSGVYFYRLKADQYQSSTRKMVLIK